MKLGIYGGTFSPPHKGHIEAARAFSDFMTLDKLLIIPALIPPHKFFGNEATATERIEMCRLAFSDIKNAEISDIEIRRGGKSYTYLTLEELASKECELYLLCGTDMILTFDEWKNFKRIFELATVCYVRREACSNVDEKIEAKISEYREKYQAKIVRIPNSITEISSTELREAMASGVRSSLISDKVFDFIKKRGLYR